MAMKPILCRCLAMPGSGFPSPTHNNIGVIPVAATSSWRPAWRRRGSCRRPCPAPWRRPWRVRRRSGRRIRVRRNFGDHRRRGDRGDHEITVRNGRLGIADAQQVMPANVVVDVQAAEIRLEFLRDGVGVAGNFNGVANHVQHAAALQAGRGGLVQEHHLHRKSFRSLRPRAPG